LEKSIYLYLLLFMLHPKIVLQCDTIQSVLSEKLYLYLSTAPLFIDVEAKICHDLINPLKSKKVFP